MFQTKILFFLSCIFYVFCSFSSFCLFSVAGLPMHMVFYRLFILAVFLWKYVPFPCGKCRGVGQLICFFSFDSYPKKRVEWCRFFSASVLPQGQQSRRALRDVAAGPTTAIWLHQFTSAPQPTRTTLQAPGFLNPKSLLVGILDWREDRWPMATCLWSIWERWRCCWSSTLSTSSSW